MHAAGPAGKYLVTNFVSQNQLAIHQLHLTQRRGMMCHKSCNRILYCTERRVRDSNGKASLQRIDAGLFQEDTKWDGALNTALDKGQKGLCKIPRDLVEVFNRDNESMCFEIRELEGHVNACSWKM